MRSTCLVALLFAACHGSDTAEVCDRWVAMNAKCSIEPMKAGTAELTKATCTGLMSSDAPDDQAMKKMDRCAVGLEDCAKFNRCMDDAIAEGQGAPLDRTNQATELVVEVLTTVTSAIRGSECDAQTAKATAALTALAPKLAKFQELITDKHVGEAVARSNRRHDAMVAFGKVATCGPVITALTDAIKRPR